MGDLIGSGVLEAQDAAGISVRQSLGLTMDAKSDRFLSNLAYKPDQVKACLPSTPLPTSFILASLLALLA